MNDNRGGARPNSGRKCLGKVPLCSRVSEQAKERLSQLAVKRGVSISDMLEVVINSFHLRWFLLRRHLSLPHKRTFDIYSRGGSYAITAFQMLKNRQWNNFVLKIFGDLERNCYLCIVHLKQAVYEVFWILQVDWTAWLDNQGRNKALQICASWLPLIHSGRPA